MAALRPKRFVRARAEWNLLAPYQRFEQLVSWVLTALISLIIAVALLRLVVEVVGSLVLGAFNPLDHRHFERIFGMIMTLLIAMEFNHSIHQALQRFHRIVQVKTVVLISILSLVRKFIILDVTSSSATTMLAMAAAVLALGVVYWLMRERDDREAPETSASPAFGDAAVSAPAEQHQ